MASYANGGNQALRAFFSGDVTLVTLDELSAFDVMNLVMLMAGIGNPAASEIHQAAAVYCFASFIEVRELVGDVTGQSAYGIACKAANNRTKGDRGNDDQRTQQAANAKSYQSQCGADDSSGYRSAYGPRD